MEWSKASKSTIKECTLFLLHLSIQSHLLNATNFENDDDDCNDCLDKHFTIGAKNYIKILYTITDSVSVAPT